MANRKLFVSLPVRDLSRSMEFFSKLGFEFEFAGETAARMRISDETFAMLLTEPFFKTFTDREVCNASTHSEALLGLSCESREDVDRLVNLAVEHGGRPSGEPQDHGFMYDWGFYDVDGHGWGVVWMNPSAPKP